MRRLPVSILFTVLTFTSAASASNYVSGFTISGSVVGGSTDRASATVTVTRDPGSNGALSILFSFPSSVGLICPPGTETGYAGYCYMPAGESTFTYYLVGSFVSSQTIANVIAKNSGNPGDQGITAQLTILPMIPSVSMSPSTIIGGGVEASSAHITLNATPASDVTVTLALSQNLGGFQPGGTPPAPVNVTYGCINVLIDDPKAKAQYDQMLQLLQAEDGNNHMLVAP